MKNRKRTVQPLLPVTDKRCESIRIKPPALPVGKIRILQLGWRGQRPIFDQSAVNRAQLAYEGTKRRAVKCEVVHCQEEVMLLIRES